MPVVPTQRKMQSAFSAWIRSHDRNVKSLEMESAAVLMAAQAQARTPKIN